DPQEDLGERDVSHCARDRPGVAMERELEAAAEACAVDRGHGRKRQGGEAAEEFVARATPLAGELSARAVELVQVGAGGEDERLPRQDERREVAALELVEHAVERGECGAAQERRLRVILAVVDRDERDVAGARELELGVRHRRNASTGRRRPCPYRRTGRSTRSERPGAR